MKKFNKVISIFLAFSLIIGVLNGVYPTSINAKNLPDNNILISETGITIDDVYYSQEEFKALLESATYIENIQPLFNETNMVTTFSNSTALPSGSWFIPVLGVVTITASGAIYIQDKVIEAGTWAYNAVKTYFAERAYEKAKEKGTKTDNHSNQSTSTKTSLPTTGKALSSKDLIDSQGVKQRRYYDKNGDADVDIDYRHAGKYEFPHRHTWVNGDRSGH